MLVGGLRGVRGGVGEGVRWCIRGCMVVCVNGVL